MYIRKTTRTYKGKTYTNYLLAESHFTPRGPRQKVICSLGDLAPRPQEQWLALARKLEGALSGQQDLSFSQPADAELDTLVAKVHAPARRGSRKQPPPVVSAIIRKRSFLMIADRQRVAQDRARHRATVDVAAQPSLDPGGQEKSRRTRAKAIVN